MMSNMILLYSIANYVTSPYLIWFPVVMSGALAIVGIIALVYMLSSSIGREDIRIQAKMKIYEIAISILMIFAFLVLATLVTSMNFEMMLSPSGLVPKGCTSTVDMFSLAICNLHEFNNNVLNLTALTYWMGVSLSFVPKLTLNGQAVVSALTGIQGWGPTADVSLLPSSYDAFIGYLLIALYFSFMLSQVEMLLLEASLLLFSMFMAIGLIARIFVITRSFGGSMIALAIGIGMLYPFLACITYGYINVGMEANNAIFSGATPYVIILGITLASISMIAFTLPAILAALGGISLAYFNGLITSALIYAGLAGAGLLLIPFVNFLIIDVFIIDFSKVIGEKMDFMKILTGII